MNMSKKRIPLNGTAERKKFGNDLYWNFHALDKNNDFEFVEVKWIGYNDDFWWNKVATTEQAQIQIGSNGRKYRIDFHACKVTEIQEEN